MGQGNKEPESCWELHHCISFSNFLLIYMPLLRNLAKNKSARAVGFLSTLPYLLLYSVQREVRLWWIVSGLGLPAFFFASVRGYCKLHCGSCLGILLRCEMSPVGSVCARQSPDCWTSPHPDLLCCQKQVSVVGTKLHKMSASLWIYLLLNILSP